MVLRRFRRHGVLTRAALAEQTGLAPATVTSLVGELLDDGLVEELGPTSTRNGAGRPRVEVRLVAERRLALGIHFGVDVVNVGLVDLAGGVHDLERVPHRLDEPADSVLGRVGELAERLLGRAGVAERCVGIGVGASGLVDVGRGINRVAPRLGWRDVPLGRYFAERLGWSARVDNNVRAMALAEALFGVGRDEPSLAFVYLGRGLGCGLVFDGRPFRGSADGAGEIGHLTVVVTGGRPCHCGNTGCLETLVSGDTLAARASALGLPAGDGSDAPSASDLIAAARGGHQAARDALTDAGHVLGIGVAALANVVNPALVVLGGLLAEAGDLILRPMRAAVQARAFPTLGGATRIVATGLGSEIGLIGAGALVLNEFYVDPLGARRPLPRTEGVRLEAGGERRRQTPVRVLVGADEGAA